MHNICIDANDVETRDDEDIDQYESFIEMDIRSPRSELIISDPVVTDDIENEAQSVAHTPSNRFDLVVNCYLNEL